MELNIDKYIEMLEKLCRAFGEDITLDQALTELDRLKELC